MMEPSRDSVGVPVVLPAPRVHVSPCADWPAEQASLRSCARTKNTCSRQRIAKVAGPRGALLSAFRLPISRGECTRRTAPAPLTHRTPAPLPAHRSPAAPRVSSRTAI
ncbi:unnamed protein product [Chrysodeixis includens]|uniref:Uncharacterized protein n=1 Tax=Chrysodeixis includens TaxID=689277 RepID=A0A9N8PXI1_CHRIL|nr:unnamed protein product [Chrysodeixis includens]